MVLVNRTFCELIEFDETAEVNGRKVLRGPPASHHEHQSVKLGSKHHLALAQESPATRMFCEFEFCRGTVPNPLDTLHVPQRRLGHCAAHLYRSELEVWSVLRQVADSCDECSVPRNVTARECLAVAGVTACHRRLVSAVTLIHVVPLVLGPCPSPSPSILSPRFHHPLHYRRFCFPQLMESQRGLIVPAQVLSISL